MTELVTEIRSATIDDARNIARVHEESWRVAYAGLIPGIHLERMINRRGPLWWANLISKSRGGLLVLDLGTVIAGYITLGRARGFTSLGAGGEIFELYVKPECQGLGFGTRLLRTGLERLAKSGKQPALIWSLEDNQRAIDFYKRHGGRLFVRGQENFDVTVLPKLGFLFHNKFNS